MEISINSFSAVQVLKQYKEVAELKETGIYFHNESKMFDLWYVYVQTNETTKEVTYKRQLVCQISEEMSLDDDKKNSMFQQANKVLWSYSLKLSQAEKKKPKKALVSV